MKKLLVLILVLGIVSVANATVSMEIYESDGTTVVADRDTMLLGSDYQLIVSGAAADAGFLGAIYGSTYTANDWDHLGPVDATVTVTETGDLSYCYWYAAYQGYEMAADDTGMGSGVSTGNWFSIALSGDAEGTFSVGMLDYSVSSTVPQTTISGTIIPEPMTIALLGLGGLLLRRRK